MTGDYQGGHAAIGAVIVTVLYVGALLTLIAAAVLQRFRR